MIVYRSPTRVVDAGKLRQISDPTALLVEFGEVEAALMDARFPERDGLAARLTLEDIPDRQITVPVAEGYAYYGLFPEMYAESTRRFWSQVRPAEVVVIGLRGIGTSLSTVVETTLKRLGVCVHSFTVRPRGHPFHRELRITEELADHWRSLGPAHFIVVDEGPGLSGSSFCGAARKLSELGIPDERIVFFSSWEGDAEAFRSEDAQRRWGRHKVFWAEYQADPGLVDISAGQWRALFYKDESDYPETIPQHEARKYLGGRSVRKFSGLGKYGEAKLQRAELLADAGFSPRVYGLDGGFIETKWVPGLPGEVPPPSRVAEYLAFRSKHFPTGDATRPQELLEMIEVNAGIAGLELPEPAAAVITDGRLLPHEWVGGSKTDALDHGDNHFFPGPTDIAWDIAALKVELGMDIAYEYAQLSGDRGIAQRLPFYDVAYRAFRSGYGKMFGLKQEAPVTACQPAA
ncbi:MAG: hypothetical protein M3Z32_01550 [Acidobacteriota bacterium]|nr:hypothetical protein [Acidobacteriota bacterium]